MPSKPFRIGVSPDFHTQAEGHFEAAIERNFGGVANVEIATLSDLTATPADLDAFDAILALALRVTADSVRGVTRPAVIARFGVGYDLLTCLPSPRRLSRFPSRQPVFGHQSPRRSSP